MSKKGCQSTRLQITPWNLGDQKREQEKLSTALIMKINWDSQRPEKLCTMYYILPAHPISWFPILGISLLLIKEAEEESWIHRQLYGNFLPHPTMTRITKLCPKHIRHLFFYKILIPQLLHGKIKLRNKEIEINIENLRRQKSPPYF